MPVTPQAAQDAQSIIAYSGLVVKTISIVKQAEGTVLGGTFGASDTHSRIETAKALMGRANDVYDSQAFSIVGVSDMDSLMRDGMYQDKAGFDYLDLASSSTDPDTIQSYKNKAVSSFASSQEDFVKVRQALNEHFERAKQETSP